MIKSYSFFSYNLNKEKFNIIKDYATRINYQKNILSNYLYNNLKEDLFYNNLSSIDFINNTKSINKINPIDEDTRLKIMNKINNILESNPSIKIKVGENPETVKTIKVKKINTVIGSSSFQQAQKDVFTKYKNQVDTLCFKGTKTKLNITINYLIKHYKVFNSIKIKEKNINVDIDIISDNKNDIINDLNQKILDLINKKDLSEKDKYRKVYYENILYFINKFGYKLLKLAYKIQQRLLNKLKLIEFKSLTFTGINQLSDRKPMIELSKNIKLTNAIINLNIPNLEKIIIPCKYNSKYHGKLNDYKYGYTSQNQSQITYTCYFKEDRIRIILTKELPNSKPIEIDNKNIIGVDVNTRDNLFALSDEYFVLYDEWLIEKYKRYEKYISRIQKTKDKRNLSKKYGRQAKKRTKKFNRISEAYANLKAKELVVYCLSKNIKHIIMEELDIKNKTYAKKEGINYNNISKILHLNDYKNIVKRIANKYGIMVSWVNPRYTSQTCPHCGHIAKNNRKQGTFSCLNCKHTNNADTNAAINIKMRVFNEELRDSLMEYKEEENMYLGKRYISKSIYSEIYKEVLNK